MRTVGAVDDLAGAHVDDPIEAGRGGGHAVEQVEPAQQIHLFPAGNFSTRNCAEFFEAIDQHDLATAAGERQCRNAAAEPAADDRNVRAIRLSDFAISIMGDGLAAGCPAA